MEGLSQFRCPKGTRLEEVDIRPLPLRRPPGEGAVGPGGESGYLVDRIDLNGSVHVGEVLAGTFRVLPDNETREAFWVDLEELQIRAPREEPIGDPRR